MGGALAGQVAVLAGRLAPSAAIAARRLGNEGAAVALVGCGAEGGRNLEELMAQFGSRCIAVEADLEQPDSVHRALNRVESQLGSVDIVLHALAAADSAEDALLLGRRRRQPPPLMAALNCTAGAMRHMGTQAPGHIVHLLPGEVIGAEELERVTLSQIRRSWPAPDPSRHVAFSAIRVQLAPAPWVNRSNRLLEQHMLDFACEEDWVERVLMEERIGDLIIRICTQSVDVWSGRLQTFGIHSSEPVAPTLESDSWAPASDAADENGKLWPVNRVPA